ncbi:hypothetical protein P154DRAFT_417801, partial [Amniculicola lignicola CBS 123094]
TWLNLLRYAQEVFSTQDTRRFVLGFTLCGSMMRAIGSMAFEINENSKIFVLVMLGYLWMSEEELGFDPTIMENNGRYTE